MTASVARLTVPERKRLPAEPKVWGSVRHAFGSPHCAVSVLHTALGGYCSRHWHKDRINRFLVVTGAIEVVYYSQDKETARVPLTAGDQLDVPAEQIHRFEVIEPGIVVEVYWPSNSGQVQAADIHRLDSGGRS